MFRRWLYGELVKRASGEGDTNHSSKFISLTYFSTVTVNSSMVLYMYVSRVLITSLLCLTELGHKRGWFPRRCAVQAAMDLTASDDSSHMTSDNQSEAKKTN